MILRLPGNGILDFSKGPVVMGILNVTPDSFSDGGTDSSVQGSVERAVKMVEEGARIIDVGGESTRPGYVPVPEAEEIRRVVPVVRALSSRLPRLVISVDTCKAGVARAALEAGAAIVNDESALEVGGEAMCDAIREYRAGVVLMHSRQVSGDGPCMAEVTSYLSNRLSYACEQTGLPREYFVLDPGIGFGKTVSQNLEMISELGQLRELGCPVLIGPSRKSFIGHVTGRDVHSRVAGTVAAAGVSAFLGAEILRVHDVPAGRDAVLIGAALRDAVGGGSGVRLQGRFYHKGE